MYTLNLEETMIRDAYWQLRNISALLNRIASATKLVARKRRALRTLEASIAVGTQADISNDIRENTQIVKDWSAYVSDLLEWETRDDGGLPPLKPERRLSFIY